MEFGEFFDYPQEDGDPAPDAGVAPVLGQGWSEERWNTLLGYSERLRVLAGERLVRLGDVEQAVYIIESGGLEAVVALRTGTRGFPISPGEVFGEVAFFDARPRTADVVAQVDSTVRRFSTGAIETLSARNPDLAHDFLMELGTILAFRLRRAEALARA